MKQVSLTYVLGIKEARSFYKEVGGKEMSLDAMKNEYVASKLSMERAMNSDVMEFYEGSMDFWLNQIEFAK